MDKVVKEQVYTYFKQQAELGIPDYIFTATGLDNYRKNVSQDNMPGKCPVHEELSGYDEKRSALVELYHEVKNCTGCNLGAKRKKLVFGAGNAAAPLMIIGEAPGYDEDMQGMPFVGKAGALLTKMLAAINVDREKDVFITNVLKCRPPENRNPNMTEALACMPILKRQIAIINPDVIIALGRIAAHELLNISDSIGKLRAETHNYNDIPVLVTYHPAALLRNEQYKRPAWEDLQKLQNILREKGIYGNDEK